MRPAGEIRQALLQAARDLATPQQAPTLTELAHKACVAVSAARRTVDNMKRAGELREARTRKVDYRNKPVAEYEPAPPAPQQDEGYVDVARVFGMWVQR
jgi:Cdc6-like AAA superfamily ATPase